MEMKLNNSRIYQQDIELVINQVELKKLSGSKLLITGATGMIASVIIDILMQYNSTINDSS